jgi:recombination protein RecA
MPIAKQKPPKARVRLDSPSEESGGLYHYEEPDVKEFIPSGCTLLDQVLGGGWAMRRVSNIIGDKSTNKTGLAIEACNNFARKYPKNRSQIYYREAEAAFDRNYAANKLGLPLDRIDFLPDMENPKKGEFLTAEDFNRDLEMITECHKDGKHAVLYICDSLDALSDEAEQEREIGKGSYGAGKAKQLSTLFRQRIQPLSQCNMHLMIISQIRDKIGVTFGKKTTRSGGHALDFYASQIIELALVSHLDKTINKIKRDVGIQVKAYCSKNKVTEPYQTCEFPLLFNFGIDNVRANIEWLDEVGMLEEYEEGIATPGKLITRINKYPDEAYDEECERLAAVTIKAWKEVKRRFEPTRRKYR